MLAVILATLLGLLTAAVIANPVPSQDLAMMNWIGGWDLPGLSSFFTVVSLLTSTKAGLFYGAVGLVGLLIARKPKAALAFIVVGAVVAAVSLLGDYTLGNIVDRSRPIAGNTVSSYPSGHVFGGTVLFGFLAFLAIQHRLPRRISNPVITLSGLLIAAVGPSRIYEGAHWPSDVAAGYLLAGVSLMFLFPLYRRYLETGLSLGVARPGIFSAVKWPVIKRAGQRKGRPAHRSDRM